MKLTKNTYITLFVGIIAIYFFTIIFSLLSHLLLKGSFISSMTMGMLAFFLGSLIVGYKIKHKGWLYGAITGLLLSAIFLLLNLLGLFAHPAIQGVSQNAINTTTLQTIIKNITTLPFNVFFASLGGLVGERFLSQRKVS